MTTSGKDSLRISAVICTYRHPDMLRAAVKSLLNQTLPAEEYEIIVVDNNSQDETANVVNELAETVSHPVRYIFEGQQGLSYARNAGIEAARGDIIAFLDDDAEADPGWLAALLDVYDSVPEAWAVGGKVLPKLEVELPRWLEDKDAMFASLSILELGEEIRPLKQNEIILGANCSFRKNVFIETGLFSSALGRKGTLLLGFEEIEIQQHIHDYGKLVFYTPQAVVYHYIPQERLTKRYLYSRHYGSGISEPLLLMRNGKTAEFYKRILLNGGALLWLSFSLTWRIWKDRTSFRVFQRMAYNWGYFKQAIILILLKKNRTRSTN
ncbi:MAG: glycosyltransferase [Dehalococcoidia bacterium]|jgi:glycosyltransferase involved in cell wall biosynthesis